MDIMVRATVVYGVLWLFVRGTGKRSLMELTPLDLLVVVILGDLLQQGITHEDTSVTGALLAAGTFVAWTLLADVLSRRSRRAAVALSGEPALLVLDGRVLRDALDEEGLSLDDLKEAARENGFGDLADVRLAVLEVDGKISFVPR